MKKNKVTNKRYSWLTIFAVLMIVLGVAILLYPVVGNYIANRERSEATAIYNNEIQEKTKEEITQQIALAQKYNTDLYNRQIGNSANNSVNYSSLISNQSIMGTIEVPAINVKSLPFYHGTSYSTLDKGLGHYEKSSIPIGGENTRAIITGHSGMKNQVLFSDIQYLKEGDIFFIHILGETLAYQIESFEEVLPTEVDRISIQKNKDMVTLLTCTPPGINTYRLLVNGVRIPYEKAKETKVKKRNLFSYQTIVLSSLFFCIVLGSIIGIIYFILNKQSKSNNPIIAKKAQKKIKFLVVSIRSLFILLLIAMLIVLGVTLYGYTQMEKDVVIEDVNIGENNELYAYNADKIINGNYDTQQIRSVNTDTYAKSLETLQENVNKWGIGKLVIPDVTIDLPILSGLSNENLLNGAATLQENQSMGESNYVLLAHNLVGANVLLNEINKIKIGDEIYVTDFKNVYTYKATRNEIIKETEVDVMDGTVSPMITLIRCEGGVGTIFRYLVQGELSNKEALDNCSNDMLSKLGLVRKQNSSGKIMMENPLSYIDQLGINFASTLISDPVQTIVPLFLLFLFPIIILGLMR